jgi:hypothetical protein
MLVLKKSRQLFQALHAYIGVRDTPSGPHDVQGLRLLLFGQFVDDIPHLVIAATLHRLFRAEDFVNGRARLSESLTLFRRGPAFSSHLMVFWSQLPDCPHLPANGSDQAYSISAMLVTALGAPVRSFFLFV